MVDAQFVVGHAESWLEWYKNWSSPLNTLLILVVFPTVARVWKIRIRDLEGIEKNRQKDHQQNKEAIAKLEHKIELLETKIDRYVLAGRGRGRQENDN